jgi:hypothetical protein
VRDDGHAEAFRQFGYGEKAVGADEVAEAFAAGFDDVQRHALVGKLWRRRAESEPDVWRSVRRLRSSGLFAPAGWCVEDAWRQCLVGCRNLSRIT